MEGILNLPFCIQAFNKLQFSIFDPRSKEVISFISRHPSFKKTILQISGSNSVFITFVIFPGRKVYSKRISLCPGFACNAAEPDTQSNGEKRDKQSFSEGIAKRFHATVLQGRCIACIIPMPSLHRMDANAWFSGEICPDPISPAPTISASRKFFPDPGSPVPRCHPQERSRALCKKDNPQMTENSQRSVFPGQCTHIHRTLIAAPQTLLVFCIFSDLLRKSRLIPVAFAW